MKRLAILGTSAVVLVAVALLSINPALSRFTSKEGVEFKIERENVNPWTNLNFNNDRNDFQFAIVSDRTGGHRAKIFSRAVQRLNLMQPEFVLSVGDLIEGYSEDKEKIEKEWKEFDSYVRQLKMPFFYVPGNHDLTNKVMKDIWKERYGRPYYHFVYRNTLFLLVNSEDTPNKGGSKVSEAQLNYFKQVLDANKDVRWTIVALHKPLWVLSEKTGWLEMEKLLEGRRYTVFAGHVHRYQKFVRNGMNYYQLATTGGGSRLRGTRYGEFDHITWVTMRKDGPVIANVLLDGILPENLDEFPSEEPAHPAKRKKTHPTRGVITLNGKPLPEAFVVFHYIDPETKKLTRAGDAITDEEGRYVLSTYQSSDGSPAGEFKVTIVWPAPYLNQTGKPWEDRLKGKYGKTDTTPLKVTVKEGENTLNFELSN